MIETWEINAFPISDEITKLYFTMSTSNDYLLKLLGKTPKFNLNLKTRIMKNRMGFLRGLCKTCYFVIITTILFSFMSTSVLAQEQENLPAIEDAFYSTSWPSGTQNVEFLRIDKGVRTSYLKFDLSNINGTIDDVKLEFTVYSDPGSGNIDVQKGSFDTWSDSDVSPGSAPSAGVILGSINTSYVVGSTYTVTLDKNQIGNGLVSLVLDQTGSGANDTDIASNENTNLGMRPKLIVTYTPPATDNPPVINSFGGTATSDSEIDLNWSASDDNGVTGYTLTMNGVTQTLSSSTATSFTASGLSADTSYDFQLTASDVSNNSTVSQVASVMTQASGGGSSQYDADLAIRINSGGPTTTIDGNIFQADQYFTGGQTYSNSATGLPEPYVSERYSSSTVQYNIPVVDGPYRVVLHFAEIWIGATGGGTGGTGSRIFDVNIEGVVEEANYDIFGAVGTETPDVKTYDISVTGGELNIIFSSSTGDSPQINGIEVLGSNLYGQNPPPSGGGQWTTTGSNDIYFNGGNVGIGVTPRSNYMLAVAGDIISERVRVELQGDWPDYVFKDDYDLPTLEEVKKQIQENGHLMNMPSAAQVKEEGIDLGEMNKLLLEKVEELTLYLIQQEERIQELENNK